MNNEYVAKYAKWRTGVMPHEAKVIVRESVRDGVDPEPLLLEYYQRSVNPIPKINYGWDCPTSPDGECNYQQPDGSFDEDCCIYCGLPDERK